VSFAAIILCIASQRVFIVVYFVILSAETFGYTLVDIQTLKKLAPTNVCSDVLQYARRGEVAEDSRRHN
jgi:hypothetical protein